MSLHGRSHTRSDRDRLEHEHPEGFCRIRCAIRLFCTEAESGVNTVDDAAKLCSARVQLLVATTVGCTSGVTACSHNCGNWHRPVTNTLRSSDESCAAVTCPNKTQFSYD